MVVRQQVVNTRRQSKTVMPQNMVINLHITYQDILSDKLILLLEKVGGAWLLRQEEGGLQGGIT